MRCMCVVHVVLTIINLMACGVLLPVPAVQVRELAKLIWKCSASSLYKRQVKK